MGRAVPDCLNEESLRISIEVLHILESARMRMHARDYRDAAAHLYEALAGLGVGELVELARSRYAVLAEAAEAVLFAYGCEDRIDATDARRLAAFHAAQLMHRLRRL